MPEGRIENSHEFLRHSQNFQRNCPVGDEEVRLSQRLWSIFSNARVLWWKSLMAELLWYIYKLILGTKKMFLQKMLSDEITKKISTWISEATSKCILMWQLHLFSSCPRINCTAEIRHPACSMQTEAQAGSKLWITTLPLILFTWLHLWHFLQYSTQLQCDYDKRLR